MSEAVFLVPSVMWHGPDPAAPDVTPPDSEQLLWQLDRVLLLVEIAGYQAREVVLDVPGSDPAATDLLTGVTGPPGSNWVAAGAPGQIGVWIGPRTGMGALEEPSAAPLALQPVDFGTSWPDAAGLSLGFTPTAAGWLTLPVSAGGGDLYTRIKQAVDALIGTLRAGIAAAYQASLPGPGDVPVPGLLSMVDPDTWNLSSGSQLPDAAAWTLYGPTLVQLGRSIRDLVLAGDGIGLATFLTQETSAAPAPSTLVPTPAEPDPEPIRRHSALERLRESAELLGGSGPALPPDVQPGQWLAGMYAALRPGVLQPPLAVAELDLLTWTEVLLILHRTGVVDFLSYRLAPAGGDLYGGRDLVIGDTGPEVGELQRDLRALGFALIDPAESAFGLSTDWAVREFQVYAAMPTTARWLRDTFPYADGLEQVSVLPDQRYPGESTGLVDADTRAAIARWQMNQWRCPVVAEVWTLDGRSRPKAVAAGLDNVWRPVDAPIGMRVFVRDFTDGYDLPATHPPTERHVVGRYKEHSNFGGPEALPGGDHCWDEAEMLVDITGTASPSGPALSTFRAVRLVAEVECYAHLDSVNAYDRGVVSLGPCHWTFGMIPNVEPAGGRDMGAGELAGFLAYVAQRYPDTFQQAVRRFGLEPALRWESTGQPYVGTLRTYVGRLARLDAAGLWRPLPSSAADHADAVADTYRSWPWIYRWQMAGRTMPEWRAACWDFVRVRLRDVLSTPWGSDTDDGGIADPPNGPPVSIGDIFTSERAVAMVLRWHVNRPADVVASSLQRGERVFRAAAALRRVYTGAKALSSTMSGAPSTWTADDEVLLINRIVAEVPGGDLKTTMSRIQVWPKQLEKLSVYPRYYGLNPTTLLPIGETRGSYLPDYGGLPPAPDYRRAG